MKFRIVCLSVCLIGSLMGFAQRKKTPEVPGKVVAYMPGSEKQYIGSPSLCRLPDGDYLASHDFFGPKSTEHTSAISRVYRSADKGKTWKQIAEINGQFWSKLFVHNNMLYLMGTNRHHGNVIIRRSTDGGYTWSTPVDSNHGLLLEGEYHCAPMPFVEYNGRLWRAMEDAMGMPKVWGKRYRPFMMSIDRKDDPMDRNNWTVSNFIAYDSIWLNGNFGAFLEGNAVVGPDGQVLDILRVEDKSTLEEKAAIVKISADGKTATFDPEKGFVLFPGGSKKFAIRYDERSKLYWTLTNYIPDDVKAANKKANPASLRNTLALCSSPDLEKWTVRSVVLQHPDVLKHAFQYVDWMFEGKKNLVFLSRTAFDDGAEGAHRAHDANFLTFHRIKKFRKLSSKRTK